MENSFSSDTNNGNFNNSVNNISVNKKPLTSYNLHNDGNNRNNSFDIKSNRNGTSRNNSQASCNNSVLNNTNNKDINSNNNSNNSNNNSNSSNNNNNNNNSNNNITNNENNSNNQNSQNSNNHSHNNNNNSNNNNQFTYSSSSSIPYSANLNRTYYCPVSITHTPPLDDLAPSYNTQTNGHNTSNLVSNGQQSAFPQPASYQVRKNILLHVICPFLPFSFLFLISFLIAVFFLKFYMNFFYFLPTLSHFSFISLFITQYFMSQL